ncbi:MAG: HAMP domain-containing histidine kinase, partial [Desulfobacterales bacterium]|nr:HAMP domain-containing histidine kinase [Desulfobacterales bacterium]
MNEARMITLTNDHLDLQNLVGKMYHSILDKFNDIFKKYQVLSIKDTFSYVVNGLMDRIIAERILQERLKGIIEMSHTACHEISQPLMVISGYTELLLEEITEDDPKYELVH